MKRHILSIGVVTLYLAVYAIITFLEVKLELVFVLFSLSPLLVIWMVMSVLKSKVALPKELKEGEEWGYQDIRKEELGVF